MAVEHWPSAPRDTLLQQLQQHEEKREASNEAARQRGRAISEALRRKTSLDEEAE